MAEKPIRAIMIVEVAGKPANFVLDGLKTHVSRLDQVQDLQVLSKNYSEPKKIENQEAWTCFSEIEIQIPNLQRLLDLVFDFMPSSIEIVDPAEIKLDSLEATNFVNNLAGRLHRYDELAKMAQFKIKEMTDYINHLRNQKTAENKPQEKQPVKEKPTKKKSNKKKD